MNPESERAGAPGPGDDHWKDFAIKNVRHPQEGSRLVLATVTFLLVFVILLFLWAYLLLLIGVGSAVYFGLLLWRARLLGDAVKVTPDSFPEIHGTLSLVRNQLDYQRPIELYVSDNVDGKAQMIHVLGQRVIVLDGGFANELQEEQYARLRFIMGSFVGALKSRHERFTLGIILLDSLNALKFASPFLNPYYRATTYTGDQIGYLCAGSLEATLPVLARFMVGKEMGAHISVSGILEQAILVKHQWPARYSQFLSKRPHLVNRYVNVIAFAARVNQQDYHRFLGGLGQEARQSLQSLLNKSPHAKAARGTTSVRG